ncbi:hypothetical protein L1887_14973 [Cichorium endivia]|nr:hypothetical protein L1887_14973 [Cichorium endivia]
MSWFSFRSKDAETHEKAQTCGNVTESMRGKRFTHRELAFATKKFKNLVSEGEFGRVYKGRLKSGEVVAVKQLLERTLDFDVRILTLNHSNIITYLDYCTDEGQRLVVYRDHCAPEYVTCAMWSFESDIYSFGIVLLELITGRKAFDRTKKQGEQRLIDWCKLFLKDHTFIQLVDPRLEGRFPVGSVRRLVELSAMCLKELRHLRPSIEFIVAELEYTASHP